LFGQVLFDQRTKTCQEDDLTVRSDIAIGYQMDLLPLAIGLVHPELFATAVGLQPKAVRRVQMDSGVAGKLAICRLG
jgi:hypothetical protein